MGRSAKVKFSQMKTWSVTQTTSQRVPGQRQMRERPSGSMANRSQVQGRAWQDKPIGASAAVGKGARRGDNLGEEPERCFLTARIGVRREQHASDSSTTTFKKKN